MNSLSLLLIFIILAILAIRKIPETQRLEVYRRGQSIGLKGPGIVIMIPGIDKGERISVGDRGELVGPNVAMINGIQARVRIDGTVRIGQSVRVKGFVADKVFVSLDQDQVRTFVCEKCGHVNRG
jgi:regulator of protease activity HflC (stomatin/prohibitin superfamily)